MIVCDRCKTVGVPCSKIDLVTVKMPEPPMNPAEANTPARSRKKTDKPREMIRASVELCEGCINILHKHVGHFLKNFKNGDGV